MAQPQRVIIHDYAGHPFQVQLSRALAASGYDVLHLYCPQLQTPRGPLAPRPDDPPSFAVRGVDLGEPIQKYDFLKRRGQEVRYGRLVAREVEAFRPDAVISGNTNIDAQARIQRAARQVGARFHFWLQDVLGVGALRILSEKYGVLGQAVGGYYAARERRLLRRSDSVVAITEDFREPLTSWGVRPERVHVVPNWAPLDEMPERPRDNAWAREHGLVGKTVFLYSGTLGLKHNPELLVRLAEQHARDPDVRVVVVSEGLGAEHIRKRKQMLKLDNLLLLPFQPFERLPDVLGSADVLVAILEPDAGVFSVPSKVLSYLCAGRALLLAVPPENLAARTVVEAGAGVVVRPDDAEAFVKEALRLAVDAALRARLGAAARAYAERTFDIGRIADRFGAIL